MMSKQYGRDDEGASAKAEATAGLSRRGLLSAAAGGFALAASGLLLPDDLVEEAAADNHPVRRIQHRQDQRRTKHRSQLQHRRRKQQGRRSDTSPGGESKGVSGIEFLVNVFPGEGRTAYVAHSAADGIGPGSQHDWKLKKTQHLEPGGDLVSFYDSGDRGKLEIDLRFKIDIYNYDVGYPFVAEVDRLSNDPHVGEIAFWQGNPREGESAPLWQVDGYTFELVRWSDTWLRKHYRVIIRTPPA